MREIGERLGVAKVLDGSVRRAGNRVRIVAQLVDAATDEHLWAETYDRDLSDVFAIQSEVALSVAGSLRAVLSPFERERVHKRPTQDMEAYQECLLGRFQMNKRTDEGLRLAIAHFERAVALDPSYASAHAGVADAYNVAAAAYMADPPKDARVRAQSAVQRALALDPNLPEALSSLGFWQIYYQWNFVEAERTLRRATELSPSHALAFQWHAQSLSVNRRLDEAVEAARRAAELDPLSALIATESAWPLMYMRRFDDALVQLRKALDLDPNFALAHYNIGNCYHSLGMYPQAIASLEESVKLSGRLSIMVAHLGRAYAKAGMAGRAREILGELTEQAERSSGLALRVAIVCDALGEKERALEWLERGLAEREPFVGFLHMEEWLSLESIRAEPRFQAVLKTIQALGKGGS
jgi:tetratricopeptide (TPR) repeat protein